MIDSEQPNDPNQRMRLAEKSSRLNNQWSNHKTMFTAEQEASLTLVLQSFNFHQSQERFILAEKEVDTGLKMLHDMLFT
jgi:hypothetical protein